MLKTQAQISREHSIGANLIRDEIEQLINKPASNKYGYRMMTQQLRRDGFRLNNQFVNHKRALHIMRENNLLEFHGIRISMSNLGSPWQNGIVESFFKTLKTNEVYLNDYQNIYEAKQNLFNFINLIYNQERLHSSLGYLPPSEFEENWQKQNINNYAQ